MTAPDHLVSADPSGAHTRVLPIVDSGVRALNLSASRFRRDSKREQLNRPADNDEAAAGSMFLDLLLAASHWPEHTFGLLGPGVVAVVIATRCETDFSRMSEEDRVPLRSVRLYARLVSRDARGLDRGDWPSNGEDVPTEWIRTPVVGVIR